MNIINLELERKSDQNLARVIEPLASYICATDRPRETLLSALAVLFDEVKTTNRGAQRHFSSLRTDSLELVS